MTTLISTVLSCARCGGDHLDLAFEPLLNPTDAFTFWTPCPATGQPVLLAATPAPAAEPESE